MRPKQLLATGIFIWICAASAVASKEEFTEELLIAPLPDGKALTHFQFTTQWHMTEGNNFQFFNLFPKSLGKLLHKYQVEELHLTFTQGRWMYERWGYPIHAAPFGVELYAWFKPTVDQTSATILWRGLTNGLSGLLCASLQFLDDFEARNSTFGEVRQFRPFGQTARPVRSFGPEGDFNARDRSFNATMFYGTLPHEAVCTENLTPWVKLLPCRAEAGFGALLSKPQKLYDVDFHSMGIHFRPVCGNIDCTTRKLELTQTLSLVMDPLKIFRKRDFSLVSLFSSKSVNACPLASRSTIFVEPSSHNNSHSVQLTSSSSKALTDVKLKPVRMTDNAPLQYVTLVPYSAPVDVQFTWKSQTVNYTDLNCQVDVLARRYISGFGQQGGLVMLFDNKYTKDLAVSYYQVIPWFMKLYYHTLKIKQNGLPIDQEKFFTYMRIEPSEDRKSPAIMEFEFVLPANSTTFITIDFDKCFLHYTEHPPDANRGFDISSAVLTINYERSAIAEQDRGIRGLRYNRGLEWSPLLYDISQLEKRSSHQRNTSLRMYTDGLLLSLPTPDFSMSYNVIMMTCMVVFSMYFKSVFHTLTRRYSNVMDYDKSDMFIVNLFRKLMRILIRLIKRA